MQVNIVIMLVRDFGGGGYCASIFLTFPSGSILIGNYHRMGLINGVCIFSRLGSGSSWILQCLKLVQAELDHSFELSGWVWGISSS